MLPCISRRQADSNDNWGARDMYKGFDLSDKVAAITGSTAGMGLAIARGLAQCGAKIVVSSNEKEDTDQAAHALSKVSKLRACDATSLTERVSDSSAWRQN